MRQISLGGNDIYIEPVDVSEGTSRREREVKAVGRILPHVFGAGARLLHDSSGAPSIEGFGGYISVSHSFSTAVVAVNHEKPVGVDVECFREQLRRVARRVFSQEELDRFADDAAMLLQGWTLKEALYKCHGVAGLDFRNDIHLLSAGEATVCGCRYKTALLLLEDGELLAVVNPA